MLCSALAGGTPPPDTEVASVESEHLSVNCAESGLQAPNAETPEEFNNLTIAKTLVSMHESTSSKKKKKQLSLNSAENIIVKSPGL